MSAELADLGRMIGKAMAARAAEPPSVNVHVPAVAVSVDAAPLADAIQAGHQQNKAALEDIAKLLTASVCKSVAEAVALVPEADLAGVEEQLQRLAEAVERQSSDAVVAAIGEVKAALADNTKAVLDLVRALAEQNKIMSKAKTVTYDGQGRVMRVEVV